MDNRTEVWKWNPEIDKLLESYRNKFCECGCGKKLNPSRKQVRDSKSKKKPLRVLKGHHNRLPDAKKWILSGKNHPFFGKTHTEESRKKMAKSWFPKGSAHPEWKGGIRDDFPHRRGWESIRNQVLLRDNFTCQKCGVRNVRLDIHHKVWRRLFKDTLQANSLDNLITLCASCHMIIENKERKYKKRGELLERPKRIISSQARKRRSDGQS